jgi:hypothetical protein
MTVRKITPREVILTLNNPDSTAPARFGADRSGKWIMKKLLQVTREMAGSHSMLYLRYADDEVARTVTLTEDCAVAIDLDANESIVGIELIDSRNEDFAMLLDIANQRGLSLDGLFSFA